MKKINSVESTLKNACQITDASWAICAERSSVGWRFDAKYHLNKKRQDIARDYFNLKRVDSWLCGALAGGKSRTQKLPESLELCVTRLYIFPFKETQKMIIVGAENLSKKEKQIWHLLTNTGDFCSHNANIDPSDAFIFGVESPVPYDLPRSLSHILKRMIQYITCEKACLAIYENEHLKVKAHWHLPEALGKELSLNEGTLLADFKENPKPILLDSHHPDWDVVIKKIALGTNLGVWAVLPLLIGQRLVGIVALWRKESFSKDEWLRAQEFSIYAATSVELLVTFVEMINHSRRQAMLNDFALIVSSAQNLDQIVRRVFALLARIFDSESIAIFLLSSDEKTLREYRNRERRVTPRTEFLENHPIENFIREGKDVRLEKAEMRNYRAVGKNTQSVLLVLLKYRGDVIGVLALESKESAAFSGYDENLLVVIASHLAGLVEYGRLREEAEARARNLGLIHEVIQQVIGLTNVDDVVQITANLLVQHFSYELAVVLLVDHHQKLNIAGISGLAAPLVKSAFQKFEYPSKNGVGERVFATGESIMIDDTSKDTLYEYPSGWRVGSKVCVALKEGERILGIIDVESSIKNAFNPNDLLALESLAGFLTSAVSNVDRYQMLQDTIQILQTTQDELQERMEAQHAAESKLIQAAKLAAVGEMAAGVAHELNNPLTTVAGFSELVLEELPPASPQRADLEMVLREAKRARNVVRRLLDFSRQSESIRVRADLNEVIEDVAALTNHLLKTSGVNFEMHLGENLPWVLIDRDQIKQVVLNLLHNALHAMPKGGKLSVCTETRTKNNREWLVMTIQDTGTGITADDLGRIFEPFFTTKSDDGGTGLGLAVSYGIVTDHEGFVDVESAPNKGTCFTVWLPIEEEG